MNSDIKVDYVVHESALARVEKANARLFTLCVIFFWCLVISNLAWVVYECHYQSVVVTESSQDGDGVNIIGGGDVDYGAESKNR